VSEWEIQPDNPRRPDVAALIAHHVAVNLAQSSPEDCHTLDVDDLCRETVAFFSCRRGDQLLGIGALVALGDDEGEFKSMHTVAAFRRLGVARALVLRLLAEARTRGYRNVSLETGATPAYRAAREL
jgi:putative acetyltransferase